MTVNTFKMIHTGLYQGLHNVQKDSGSQDWLHVYEIDLCIALSGNHGKLPRHQLSFPRRIQKENVTLKAKILLIFASFWSLPYLQ